MEFRRFIQTKDKAPKRRVPLLKTLLITAGLVLLTSCGGKDNNQWTPIEPGNTAVQIDPESPTGYTLCTNTEGNVLQFWNPSGDDCPGKKLPVEPVPNGTNEGIVGGVDQALTGNNPVDHPSQYDWLTPTPPGMPTATATPTMTPTPGDWKVGLTEDQIATLQAPDPKEICAGSPNAAACELMYADNKAATATVQSGIDATATQVSIDGTRASVEAAQTQAAASPTPLPTATLESGCYWATRSALYEDQCPTPTSIP